MNARLKMVAIASAMAKDIPQSVCNTDCVIRPYGVFVNYILPIVKDFKDPYSAVFEGIYIGKAANGSPVVCGTVNAKNSYGAYTGRKPFYYVKGIGQIVDDRKEIVFDALCGANPR